MNIKDLKEFIKDLPDTMPVASFNSRGSYDDTVVHTDGVGEEYGKPVDITFVRGKYVIFEYEGHLSVHEWDIFFLVLERLYGKMDECKYEEVVG